jgi:antitoxin (DNA-binding transcriptional repressor) of toxin-antitoxin stability system
METISLEDARAHFDELIARVRKSGQPATVTGPEGALVQVIPLPKPARQHNGRPVYSADQMKEMDCPYPSEESWLKEIEGETEKEA